MTTPHPLFAAAARAIRYYPPEPPSKWMSREYHLSPQAAPEHPGLIDIWRQPLNIGIVDAFLERRRGILVEKCVQSAVSTYLGVGLAGYLIARYGGSVFYSLQKNETMRKHSLTRFTPLIEHSPELSALFVPGDLGNETILEKTFLNGTLTLTSAGSENNFISNAYRWAFADEFDKYGTFPSGNDAWTLLKGRQANIADPGLFAFSNPGTAEQGIHPHIVNETDARHFYLRCPLCRAVIDLDWHRDVLPNMQRHPGSDRTIPGTAALHCSACNRPITDAARYRAISDAAQRSTPWYCAATGLDPDPDLGWHTTLDPAEAAARPYAGFTNYSHLYNIRRPLADLDHDWHDAQITEEARKTFHNDILGRPYTPKLQVLSLTHVRAATAATVRRHAPSGTQFITIGVDVQGSTRHLDLYFYYDISAWLCDGHKITLDIGRLRATHTDTPTPTKPAYPEIITLIRDWQSTTPDGATHRIRQAVIDAGYRTDAVYTIANHLAPAPGPQWVTPIVYNQPKLGKALWITAPQDADLGDPARHLYLTSRDFVVGRAIERLIAGRVELPNPLSEEIADHYTSQEQREIEDRHGNRTYHYEKRQPRRRGNEAHAAAVHDDWLQAAGYAEFAAILLGLDQLDATQLAAAKTAADTHRQPRSANQNTRYGDHHQNSRIRARLKHQRRS